MKFAYQGFDAAGKPVNGHVDASDRHEAGEALRRRGVFATSIDDDGAGAKVTAQRSGGGKKGGAREVATLLRELSVLVGSGTPVVEALGSLERQIGPGPWHDTIAEVRSSVEEGVQLSDALARHPGTFNGVVRCLVAAGESGGRLDAMLDRLAKLVRQQLKVRTTLIGAMVYPTVLIAISMFVLTILVVFVMPRFRGLFETLQTPLPPTTKFVMAISDTVRGQWPILLGVLVSTVVGVTVYLKSEAGKMFRDRAMVRLPQIGRVTRNFATARITRVLGVLLEGHVPMLEAMALTRESVPNRLYQDVMTKAEDAVSRGESFSSVLNESGLFAPSVVEAIRTGEKSGRMSGVMLQLSDHLDEDNEVLIKTATGLIEPLILLLLGVVVGMVALSMFLPLFDLAGSTGSGGPGGGGA